MLKKALSVVLFFSLTTFLPATPKNLWCNKARKSVDFIEKTLRENHPAAAETESNEFKSWIDHAKEQIDEKLTHVSDENGYQLFLTWYTKGFNDGHLSVQFSNQIPQTTEWAGLLMSYDGGFHLNKDVDSLFRDQIHLCGGYRHVWAIDEIPTPDWITKNILPYQFGAITGLQSAYVKAAPLALTWANNPFIKKPKNITVHPSWVARHMAARPLTVKLTLDWQAIPQDKLSKKIATLRNLPKDKRATIQLSHNKINFQWTGNIINYEPKSTKFYLEHAVDAQIFCCGSCNRYQQVSHIDEIPIADWITKNILPHQSDATTKHIPSYKHAAPLALTWPTNLLTKRPTTITVVPDNTNKKQCDECNPAGEASTTPFLPRTINLYWEDISSDELSEKTKTKLVDISSHNAYVRIPSFAPSEANSLHHVAQNMEQARSCRSITFDLRGNTGGSSFFGQAILKSLFGAKYFKQEIFNATRKEKVLWRASKGNITYLENHPYASRLSKKAKAFLSKRAINLQNALDKGEEFFTEEAEEKDTVETQPPASTKVTAKVCVVIDAQCASSALDFIDELKALVKEDITLIGQPTSADSIYMEVCSTKAPTEIDPTFTLNYPMKAYRNRARGHNQPYTPNIFLDSETLNNDTLLHENILSIINT